MKAEASTSYLMHQMKQLKDQFVEAKESKQKAYDRETARLKQKHKQELQLLQAQMSKLHSIIYKDKKKHRQEKFQLYKQTEKLNTELERIQYTNQSAIDNASSELKNAVKVATIKERTHYVKQHEKVNSMNSNLKRKYIEQQTKVATLTDRVITSERISTNSIKVSQSQQSNTINMREKLELEMNRNELLRDRIIDLEDTVDDGRKMLQQSMAAIPITIITKEREGRRGRPQWQLYIYELIMEQLVNGTPPSSVNGNIVAHVKAFSPTTIVKELPSIWTIRRTRTILLIVVLTSRLANQTKSIVRI